MTKPLSCLAVGLSMALAPSAAAQGQGSAWKHTDGTTHWYQAVAVPGGINWEAANAAANAAGGYLVTITSAAENDFVFSLVDDPSFWVNDVGPWIGGLQPFGSPEPGGGWIWAEAEPFGFQNWAAGEPDDFGSADRLHFGGGGRVNTWGDALGTWTLAGYVIERSGPTMPRTVGLVHRESASFDGFTLFSPLGDTTTYLIDPRGRVVHTWAHGYFPGNSVYLLPNGNLLRPGRVNNPRFGNIGGSGGVVEEYDWQGNLLWTYFDSSNTSCQHHDVRRLPNGNTIVLSWELKTQQEAIAAGRDPQLLTNGVLYPDKITEIKPTGPNSGQVVWEWHAWDHLIQDFDSTKANHGQVGQHPELIDVNYPPPGRIGSGIHDWMHSNALAYNAKLDQIVLNVRHFNEFWVIDHSTTTDEASGHTGGRSGKGGDLLYRWGNPETYRAGTANDRQFYMQHDAHWIDDGLPGAGNFLVFNNGLERPAPGFSTVVELTPPTPDAQGNYPRTGQAWGPAQPTWTYQGGTAFYSSLISGAQRQPNGNTLICSGWQGVSFEVTPQGTTVWTYVCPVLRAAPVQQGEAVGGNGNQMFRTYRYAPDYPGLSGRALTPGEPIERQETVLLADGSSAPQFVTAGTSVSLSVRSSADAGRIYFVGTSATEGLLPIDWRYFRVGADFLLYTSLTYGTPSIFQNYVGILDPRGRAEATLAIPPVAGLAGLVLHSTFFVFDPAARNGVSTLANDVVIRLDG